jgi:hypothetical protein
MTDQEMSTLIDETIEARYEADTFFTDTPTQTKPNPPASIKDIARLADDLRRRGLSLPGSFTQFLRIHNGIQDYLPSMGLSIRSAEQILESVERDKGWKGIFQGYRFIFASGEDSSARVGFLPETLDARGEMQVIMRNETGETNEYSDFEEFLRDQLEYYRDVVSASRSDREELKDD